jgi:hypothetical protein
VETIPGFGPLGSDALGGGSPVAAPPAPPAPGCACVATLPADVTPYLDLITAEHQGQPDFEAMITATLQPLCDLQAQLATFDCQFDVDCAVGVQLDIDGLWVNRSRQLAEPLTGVYFAWNTAGVGWGQGLWRGPFDPVDGLVSLPDDVYRSYLLFGIAANHWDGTIPDAYTIYDDFLAGTDAQIYVVDHENMSMTLVLSGSTDPVLNALFNTGALDLRPAGVLLNHVTGDGPWFGWGPSTPFISGWGTGKWLGDSTTGGGYGFDYGFFYGD